MNDFRLILVFLSLNFFFACSEPAGIDQDITIQDGEGYYLGVVLDSGKNIHSRSDSLLMDFSDVYSLSECVSEDYYSEIVPGQDSNHLYVALPYGGVLQVECPIQNGIQGVSWWMSPDDFPTQDSLIVYGQSDYLRSDTNTSVILGGRQGLIPLDTIELRWGTERDQEFIIRTDSFAQIEGSFRNKDLQRVLVRDSSDNFYLEIYNATCPSQYINQECETFTDTLWSFRNSERDLVDDTIVVQIEIDTAQWVISKKCTNFTDYCLDVRTTNFKRAVSDTTLQLRSYETWLIEKMDECTLFNTFDKGRYTGIEESEEGFPNLGSYEFGRALFDLDQEKDVCLGSDHYYAYSFESDSLIFNQLQLDSLWSLR